MGTLAATDATRPEIQVIHTNALRRLGADSPLSFSETFDSLNFQSPHLT